MTNPIAPIGGSIVVGPSRIGGRGLFSAKPRAARDVLMIIGGEVISAEEATRRERDENNWTIYWHSDHRCLDTARTEQARFLNHSCFPNAATVRRDDDTLTLVASRDIAAGEEIVMDYDYDEIYDLCRRLNPLCAGAKCPRHPRTGG
ncbi:MAG: SET domain-containing protein [Chloroflexi bacterium]|nr:SET domain-containing protein [Chloroflexota bacterium]MBI3734511.1 SET domain-containing protein [Chloroflexota bacterium]